MDGDLTDSMRSTVSVGRVGCSANDVAITVKDASTRGIAHRLKWEYGE